MVFSVSRDAEAGFKENLVFFEEAQDLKQAQELDEAEEAEELEETEELTRAAALGALHLGGAPVSVHGAHEATLHDAQHHVNGQTRHHVDGQPRLGVCLGDHPRVVHDDVLVGVQRTPAGGVNHQCTTITHTVIWRNFVFGCTSTRNRVLTYSSVIG